MGDQGGFPRKSSIPFHVSLIQNIVWEISDREGVAPEDLETPLYEVVDPDALEALLTGTRSRQDCPNPVVEFEYLGYAVTIDGTRNVTISGHSSTPDESSRKKVDRWLENIAAEIDHRERAMKDVSATIAARERPFGDRLDGLLEVVRKTLGMESATLSYVDTDTYVFEAVDVTAAVDLQAGEIVPVADTVCKRAIETEQALVLGDVAADAPELAHSAHEVAAYIGVPVFVDNEVYGTFCFYDSDPRDEAFSSWELALVELLSNWVSSELERRRRERAVQASRTERPSA